MHVKRLEARIAEAGYPDGFHIENISLTLEPGEILLVTGRSGSGKTTLLRSLNGLIKLRKGYVKGSVKVDGEEILDKPLEYSTKKLFYIPQEPWYGIVGYTVLTEYCHTLSIYGVKCNSWKLGDYGLSGLEDKTTYGLSAGQYQRILWAEALQVDTSAILMDEPYTYIDVEGRRIFRKYVEKYISRGGSLVIVDHIPSNWSEYEPKLLVLDKGKPIYYGRYRWDVEVEVKVSKRRHSGSNEEVLVARNIWFKYPGTRFILKGADLILKRGEIIGVTGVNGSGKTTLLKILAGIYKPLKGHVMRRGSTIYIPENPLLYFTYPTPREEIYGSASNDKVVEEIIGKLGLGDLLDKPLAFLSTGERRRVALISALLAGYDILLFDEPTGGLDSYSVEVILDTIDHVVGRGATVVVAHHDPRLNGFFDREYVLENGVLKCRS